MDSSALNAYLRSIKLILEDAEQQLDPRRFASLRAILQIKLAWYDAVEQGEGNVSVEEIPEELPV